MKKIISTLIGNALLVTICFLMNSCQQLHSGWTPLLDKDLSQWNMYLGYKLYNGYHGEYPLDANGDSIPPVGYNNNKAGVFTVFFSIKSAMLLTTPSYVRQPRMSSWWWSTLEWEELLLRT